MPASGVKSFDDHDGMTMNNDDGGDRLLCVFSMFECKCQCECQIGVLSLWQGNERRVRFEI